MAVPLGESACEGGPAVAGGDRVGASSQWWAGMAVAVIFGLAFATVLTLVVVPALYVMLNRMAAAVGLVKLGSGGSVDVGEEEPAVPTGVDAADRA